MRTQHLVLSFLQLARANVHFLTVLACLEEGPLVFYDLFLKAAYLLFLD